MGLGGMLGRGDRLRIVRVGVVVSVLVAVPVILLAPSTLSITCRASFAAGLACGFLLGGIAMRWAR